MKVNITIEGYDVNVDDSDWGLLIFNLELTCSRVKIWSVRKAQFYPMMERDFLFLWREKQAFVSPNSGPILTCLA